MEDSDLEGIWKPDLELSKKLEQLINLLIAQQTSQSPRSRHKQPEIFVVLLHRALLGNSPLSHRVFLAPFPVTSILFNRESRALSYESDRQTAINEEQ